MDAKQLGQAGLQGWRVALADKTTGPVTDRTPLDEDAWRALVGATFFVLSVVYVVKTVKAVLDDA
ncbi:MAG: hypothetical protein WKF40_05630 [Thermoleophilaceae bacterium]|jgi:hypothetical protein